MSESQQEPEIYDVSNAKRYYYGPVIVPPPPPPPPSQ